MDSEVKCEHKRTIPDLVNWTSYCLDCKQAVRYISQREGNEWFNRHITPHLP